jgi:ABC-type multidrug transport system fused ATPase/permease subunit
MSDSVETELERQEPPVALGAWKLFRRGIEESPELRNGLAATIVMGLSIAVGRLVIPIVIQRTIDQAISISPDGSTAVDMGKVVTFALIALVIVLASAVIAVIARRRMIVNAEAAIYGLRTRAFAHVHKLSLADHVESSSGAFLTRVTSDVQAISRFCEFGLLTWTVGPMVLLGVFFVMAVYSWQLALLVLITFLPTLPFMKWVQGKQLVAYDRLRSSVSFMVGRANEAIIGAGTVRAYGVGERAESRVREATDQRYMAGIRRNKYMAMVFSTGDFFGSLALAGAFAIGVWQRDNWGISGGTLVAVLFLITLLNEPIGELGETTDRTQEAIAGWRKILELLDTRVDIVEPDAGHELPREALSISAVNVDFAYRTGPLVLRDVSLQIPAGTNVAVVGETGSGKTTFAKLLCRLADPISGHIELGGVRLEHVSAESRLGSVRMVPQDGFLFDTTLRENLRLGRLGASDADIAAAVSTLELDRWVADLPNGLDTEVGARGGYLSVGERQLVALIRAALADPGLLILDEATSSVDPETDRALTDTIARLSSGRTVVSIAHRLATAEAADLIVVFDQGEVVEVGPHRELVDAGGIYGRLHQAWVGNTQREVTPEG